MYVIPKNLLKRLIIIADLKTQIGALIYGKSGRGNSKIK